MLTAGGRRELRMFMVVSRVSWRYVFMVRMYKFVMSFSSWISFI